MTTFIEVCAGAGGLSKGLIDAGFTPILLMDNDKKCCETLTYNHPEVYNICGDINDYDLSNYYNKIDLLCSGIPCQSFSYSGKKLGLKDIRGMLIYQFINFINEINPKVFLIENVKGLLTHNKGETLKSIIPLLSKPNKKEKYRITYKILNAYDYEVPQKRERLFIIGTRTTNIEIPLDKFVFPSPLTDKRIVLRDVLTDCPKSIGMSYSEKKKTILDMVKQGECWVNLPLDIQKEYLGNSFNSGGGKRGIARRLHMDHPSLTLTTSPCQKQTERCHPLETRPLTVREYARIQTFPDDYEFKGSISAQYKQIGNAVPVKLAYHIGLALQKLFPCEIVLL